MEIKGQFSRLSALALLSTVLLNGCVADSVTADIDPINTLPYPEQSTTLAEINEVGSSPQTTLNSAASNDPNAEANLLASVDPAAVPVPTKSPNSALAMVANDAPTSATNATQASSSVIDDTQSTEPTTALTASLAPPAAVEVIKPARKLSFFERLRKQAEERRAKKLQAKQVKEQQFVLAKLEADKKRQNSVDLPGVKQGDQLFGIESAVSEETENVQVASVGGYSRPISKNGLILQTTAVKVGCFRPELLKVLKTVERKYRKKVMVTSGYRSPARNRRAGGVKNSTHVYCKAADIQVAGVNKWDLAKYLRTIPGRGGVGTYCRTNSVHVDVGTQRDWHHPCKRRKSKRKKR